MAVQLTKAKSYLGKLEDTVIDVGANLHLALGLVADCGSAYAAATPALRRQWNQAFFIRLAVDEERVTEAQLASPFDLLLHREVVAHYRRESPEPLWDAEEGIEDALGAWGTEREETGAVLVGGGLNRSLLVELIAVLSNPRLAALLDLV